VTGFERYRRVATETCSTCSASSGTPRAFFSSQDADSEGVEAGSSSGPGRPRGDRGGAVATAFGAAPDGNWEGTNVLWRPLSLEAVAEEMELDPEELAGELDGEGRLFGSARAEPTPLPTTDLTVWNGLAIAPWRRPGGRSARSVRGCRRPHFVLTHLRDDRGGCCDRGGTEGRRTRVRRRPRGDGGHLVL
jgi:uncharacterized protein YyaL (SSP411 family)